MGTSLVEPGRGLVVGLVLQDTGFCHQQPRVTFMSFTGGRYQSEPIIPGEIDGGIERRQNKCPHRTCRVLEQSSLEIEETDWWDSPT